MTTNHYFQRADVLPRLAQLVEELDVRKLDGLRLAGVALFTGLLENA